MNPALSNDKIFEQLKSLEKYPTHHILTFFERVHAA